MQYKKRKKEEKEKNLDGVNIRKKRKKWEIFYLFK